MEGEKLGLLAVGIAATLWLIHFLFFDWIWRPTDFEMGLQFRIILSGFIVAAVIGVEIVIFRWLSNQ